MRHKVEEKQKAEKALLGEGEKLQQIAHTEFKSIPFNVQSDGNRIEPIQKAKMVTKKISDIAAPKKMLAGKK